MKLTIKKGRSFTEEEIPLLGYARDLLKTDREVPINFSHFKDDVEPERDYVVLDIGIYRRLSEDDKTRICDICSDMNLTGHESRQDLETALARQNTITVGVVVDKVNKIYNQLKDPQVEAELKEQVSRVQREVGENYTSPALDQLLDDERVCIPVTSLTHPGISNLPALTPELAQQVAKVELPFYIVLDVSGSMAEEDRYLHAQALAKQIHHYIRTEKLSDDVRLIIYSGAVQEIPISAHKLVCPQDSTATGSALGYVGGRIALEHPGKEVYIALITDGQPTDANGFFSPQEYAEEMAAQLPERSKLIQFAFSPVDPSNRDGFAQYLENINNITERAPFGQTIVLVKGREELLTWLAIGGHQRVKHLCLMESNKGSGQDLTDIVES